LDFLKKFFSNFAGQSVFVDITLFVSAVYVVHALIWTRPGQVGQKTWDSWDSVPAKICGQ
jgi:hypothetical protein